MLAISTSQTGIWQNNLAATPSTTAWGTLLTASGTPHEKGGWTALLTATYDSYGFWLGIMNSSVDATQSDKMLDLAIGAGQENIILPDYLCGWRGNNNLRGGLHFVFIPIFLSKGAILSGRLQSLIASGTASVVIMLNGGTSALPGPLYSGCDAYGTVQASSQGTSHTPGNTGTESTEADIGSPLSRQYKAVMLMVQGTMATTATTNIAYHWELVIGGVAICEWYAYGTINESNGGPFPPIPFPVSLPSGTQLQVRAEASGTAQAFDVAFYAFY